MVTFTNIRENPRGGASKIMTSIPDWARLAQMTENKHQISQKLLDKFYKQKEVEAFKEAEELGYFLHPSTEVLLSHCGEQNVQNADLADIRFLHLSGVRLRVLGDIDSCTRLTICLLANNFLTRIDALVACRHLVKLDVHSNQLMSVPGSTFWKSMDNLQVLHLHDNPIGKFETLENLGLAPNLSILTLYDTPLSLQKNYRHHAVNTICTLKALDMYVISDEEIIEDAMFVSERFKAMSPAFRINLCPQTAMNSTFAQEMSVLQALNAKVNSVLARHSAVHIIQRYIRGHLFRRKIGTKLELRPGHAKIMIAHLPSTPVCFDKQIKTSPSGEAIDYDGCVRSQSHSSLIPIKTGESRTNSPSPSLETQHVHIDVQKLKSSLMFTLQNDSSSIEDTMTERKSQGLMFRDKKGRKKLKSAEKNSNPKSIRIKDVKQFFGPLVPTCMSEVAENNEIPLADFRLKGRKPTLLIVDATTEMILSKKEAGQMVREAEAERLTRKFLQPVVEANHNTLITAKQRLFKKTFGTMGLSCLMSVDRAYRDREKLEAAAVKTDNLIGMREDRLRAKDRINMYLDERRAKILKSKNLDRENIRTHMQNQELQYLSFLNKQQEQKIQSLHSKKVLTADHAYMKQFSCQHSSVSDALLRYDHQAHTEDSRNQRQKKVSTAKLNEMKQREVIKCFLEHQKLMKQTKAAMAKAAVTTKILAETKERASCAQNRVANQKMRQANIQTFHSVPVSHVSSASADISKWDRSSDTSTDKMDVYTYNMHPLYA